MHSASFSPFAPKKKPIFVTFFFSTREWDIGGIVTYCVGHWYASRGKLGRAWHVMPYHRIAVSDTLYRRVMVSCCAIMHTSIVKLFVNVTKLYQLQNFVKNASQSTQLNTVHDHDPFAELENGGESYECLSAWYTRLGGIAHLAHWLLGMWKLQWGIYERCMHGSYALVVCNNM